MDPLETELQAVKAEISEVKAEKAGLEAKAEAIEKKKPDTYEKNATWLSLQPRITAKETNLGELRKKENNVQAKIDASSQAAVSVKQGICLVKSNSSFFS